jgi:hypothetical protein
LITQQQQPLQDLTFDVIMIMQKKAIANASKTTASKQRKATSKQASTLTKQ